MYNIDKLVLLVLSSAFYISWVYNVYNYAMILIGKTD